MKTNGKNEELLLNEKISKRLWRKKRCVFTEETILSKKLLKNYLKNDFIERTILLNDRLVKQRTKSIENERL